VADRRPLFGGIDDVDDVMGYDGPVPMSRPR
jgi:hypothetical protein